MHSFTDWSSKFEQQFKALQFPDGPPGLYNPCRYMMTMGGKRVRPVSVLMGNELFSDISPDSFHAANAIELFHNFTLMHDDIMDQAPLRRGLPTVPEKFGVHTALLAGDVMMIAAYEHLNRISGNYLNTLLTLFNLTAKQVCEGQQLDMDFEKRQDVTFDEYLYMITLKTSVLLAASLQLGAIIGGAGLGNQISLYEFGKNLGIAFQIQDDYLDAFGDPDKFGKQVGGDILSNKKTFLLIHALETADSEQKSDLLDAMVSNPPDKVARVLDVFRACGVDAWAQELKDQYYMLALEQLDRIAVLSSRKTELKNLAQFLLKRES